MDADGGRDAGVGVHFCMSGRKRMHGAGLHGAGGGGVGRGHAGRCDSAALTPAGRQAHPYGERAGPRAGGER